jgi:hypothetical protein
MDGKMLDSDDGNLRKNSFPPLTLIRNESPDEWLDRRVVEWAVAGKVNGTGRVATGDLYDVACGKRWPLRLLARLLSKALVNGATFPWAFEIADIVREYVERKKAQLAGSGARVA